MPVLPASSFVLSGSALAFSGFQAADPPTARVCATRPVLIGRFLPHQLC